MKGPVRANAADAQKHILDENALGHDRRKGQRHAFLVQLGLDPVEDPPENVVMSLNNLRVSSGLFRATLDLPPVQTKRRDVAGDAGLLVANQDAHRTVGSDPVVGDVRDDVLGRPRW